MEVALEHGYARHEGLGAPVVVCFRFRLKLGDSCGPSVVGAVKRVRASEKLKF